ncbi:MAG: pentapeptide repeat-containing protein [Planctomycetota bacterium]
MAKKKAKFRSNWKRPRFTGSTLCFTGKPDAYGAKRSEYEAWAREEGAEIADALSANVDILIVLEKGATAAAVKKAQSLNQKNASISTISEREFREAFTPEPDEVLELIAAGPKGRARLADLLGHSESLYYKRHGAIDLSGSKLRGADLTEVMLKAFTLDNADLRETKLDTTETGLLKNVWMDKAHGDHFRPTGMQGCRCKNADLPNLFMGYNTYGSKNNVVDCDFAGTNLQDAYFGYMEIRDCSFKKTNLAEVDFSNARLIGVDFASSDLSKAELNGVKSSSCIFHRANFCEASLHHADLNGADLRNADFSGAQLLSTDFNGADISGANFKGAILIGASFDGVDLSKAKNLELPPKNPVKLGTATRDLGDVAKQAEGLNITANVDLDSHTVRVQIDKGSYYQRKPFVSRYEIEIGDKSIKDSTEHQTFRMALTAVGETWAHGKLKFDTIKVTSSKSPIKGKALSVLAVSSLAEAFGVDVPSDEEIKAKRKQSREKLSDIKAGLLEQLRGGKEGVEAFNQRDAASLVRKKHHQLRKEDFTNAKLAGVSAPGFDFQDCDFTKASLRQANLTETICGKSKFCSANLRSADFKYSELSFCDFSSSQLQKADLQYTVLRGVNFQNADLTGASLLGSDLRGAVFTGATVDKVDWGNSNFDEETVFPEGFEIPDDFDYVGIGLDPRKEVDLPSAASVGNFDDFMVRLTGTVDQSRLKKSLKMLKADRFELFSEVTEDSFRGVVKSQSDSSLVYSCQLTSEGEFCCCTQNLNPCGGLRGALCKHLLVLIVGLTKGGQLDANLAASWAHESLSKKPNLDKDLMSEVLLKYKGAEAGDVDWRPMETIPEDYYAL